MIPNNACTLRITAAAGTELAGASSGGTVNAVVSYYQTPSSLPTVLYDPRAFITHAALLRQAFAHCAIFPTAASRRSLGRVSVPVWLVVLSDQLPIVALVGHYPANKLMGRGLISGRKLQREATILPQRRSAVVLSGISGSFPPLSRSRSQITHVLLTRAPLY